jgi:hypothetical protein
MDLAIKGNLQNQIRAYKNACIINIITFLYLYDGWKLKLKLMFRSQKSEVRKWWAVGAMIMFDGVRL